MELGGATTTINCLKASLQPRAHSEQEETQQKTKKKRKQNFRKEKEKAPVTPLFVSKGARGLTDLHIRPVTNSL
jgi:hypothetical protein